MGIRYFSLRVVLFVFISCMIVITATAQTQTSQPQQPQTPATNTNVAPSSSPPQAPSTTPATDVTIAKKVVEERAPLTEQPTAYDAQGRVALAARLRTPLPLNGSPDVPTKNVRVVIENRSDVFYNYVSGWVTFYDAEGVRCGEGLYAAPAIAPGESVETDTPGLRLKCSPASWRVTAETLLTRTGAAKEPAAATTTTDGTTTTTAPPPTASEPIVK